MQIPKPNRDTALPADNAIDALLTDGALTLDMFCEKYSTSRATTYREIARGALVAKKRGTRTLIPIESARQWFAALPDKAQANAA